MSPLSKDEQRSLLELARRAIATALAGSPLQPEAVSPGIPAGSLREPGAVFVTLHRQGQLRGCVGMPRARKPLYQAVIEGALSAAFYDPRFPSVAAEELPALEIEISVLSPLVLIQPDQVIPGEHGLMVSDGFQRGLLLPQVAREYGWSREQFLEETCAKAGLERMAWKRGVQLEAFTAFVFSEADCGAEPVPARPHPSPP